MHALGPPPNHDRLSEQVHTLIAAPLSLFRKLPVWAWANYVRGRAPDHFTKRQRELLEQWLTGAELVRDHGWV